MPQLDRRAFLGASAIALAADLAFAADPPDWFDRPMRWAQLAFVEDDPGQFNADFWLDYFRRTHSDAACLSAGGCVAFYPTEIPLHYRSQWLGNRDPFGDLVAGCRKLDMVVIARTDPHAAHPAMAQAHPDWIAVDAEGNPRRHGSMPGWWLTCALGPYNFDFMTQVTKEIVQRYKVDSIFSNRWSGSGMCYCQHCRENFKAASGYDLPRSNDPHDPVRMAHTDWRARRLFELWDLWDGEIRKINPGARFIPNTGGGALSELDMKRIGEKSATLCADRQARSGLTPLWAAGRNAKEYRSTMGNKAIAGMFSVGVEEAYRWKDSVQSPAEIRMWVLDSVANGMRPWFIKFAATLRDHRWLPVVEKVFDWHFRNERYLRNQAPMARAALVYSQQTARFYGGAQARQKVEDHTLGYYHALVEARIPFEMAHDGLLDAGQTSGFKALILPNLAALSDQQCRQIREFVERGGGIVATHETSLYDERGVRRADFGLAELFGASYDGAIDPRMQNSYLRLEAEGKARHPLLAGLEDAERIINGISRVHTRTTAAYPNPPLTLIPSYPDLPMEEVYPRTPKTDIPEVFVRDVGKGRVVYFPWDIDRTFWEVLAPDHAKLLRNAVEWALNEAPVVSVTGPGTLDVTVWRQKDSMTVHLVNLTNPMLMKGPVRELIPAPAQKVAVRLPAGMHAKKVQLLGAGQAARAQESNGVLTVTVPSVLDLEVVAIDL
ncbi:MAG TPA: beta-galactosidase trimerization domain-containing protein [Verrucomicrobiae bacterium]|nr:beta-galactosidase trimerization domain-containing protein [Verrucomicrobiae bacterium]